MTRQSAQDLIRITSIRGLGVASPDIRRYCDANPLISDVNQLIVQCNLYDRITSDYLNGSISFEQREISINKATAAVLGILNRIRDINITQGTFEVELSEKIDVSEFKFQKLLGANNLKTVNWLHMATQRAKSVCRMRADGKFATGFLVSPKILMTNHHVISSREDASNWTAEFNYELNNLGGYCTPVCYKLDPSLCWHTSATLDYSLVGLHDLPDHPLDNWGLLTVNPNTLPKKSDYVSVIQHPNGQHKQIVLSGSMIVDIKTPHIYYTSDTMEGSSGSPVFDDTWHVIAIHRGSEPDKANEGVLMSEICDNAKNSKIREFIF